MMQKLHNFNILMIAACFVIELSRFIILCDKQLPVHQPSRVDNNNNRLLLISFDGFRWNYLNRTLTPNFDSIVRDGVSVRNGVRSAYVTKTLPNHFTLVTGLWPESHSVVGNVMYDPVLNGTMDIRNSSAMEDSVWFDRGAEPIWVTNQRRHGRSGVIMWPGAGAAIKNVRPSRYIPFKKGYENKKIIDQMIDWLDDTKNSINLGIIYIDEPDRLGHAFGPESVQVTDMIAKLDTVVGYLFDHLRQRRLLDTTNIIITSDHGIISTPLNKQIDLDEYIDPASYDIIETSPIAGIWPKPGHLEELLQNLTEGAKRNGHFSVYRKEDIPSHFHFANNRRISPIHAVADNSFSFTSALFPYTEKGNHGYDNRLPDMHSLFVARGPAFKSGFTVDTFDSVDVYPLMCHVMGLEPAPNNGSLDVVRMLLKDTRGQRSPTEHTHAEF